MKHIDNLNFAINYIEANLTQPLLMQQVAACVGYSRFHFDRLFLATVGVSPTGYLRKRRLTEAARELVQSNKPLLDIALDYQFQSQEAFTRAFRRMFGLSPGAYRRRRCLTRPFFKITVQPQPLFSLSGNAQAFRLLLPNPGLTTRCPLRVVLLIARSTDVYLLRQEVAHAHRLTPTQLRLTLDWASAFRHW